MADPFTPKSQRWLWAALLVVSFACAVLLGMLLKAPSDKQPLPKPLEVPTTASTGNAITAEDEKPAPPPPSSPSDVYKLTDGQAFSSSKSGKCSGAIWVFSQADGESARSLSVHDSKAGITTLWKYSVSGRGKLTISLTGAEVRDDQGNVTDDISPDDHREAIRVIDTKTIQIGDQRLRTCGDDAAGVSGKQ